MPANESAVAPVRFVPVTTTVVPTAPLVGRKLAMAGIEVLMVKSLAERPVPLAVVTEILPVVAALGTVSVICVALFTVNVAGVPFTAAAVAPVKLVPVTVTLLPIAPLAGEKLVIVGAGTELEPVELALPPPQALARNRLARANVVSKIAQPGDCRDTRLGLQDRAARLP